MASKARLKKDVDKLFWNIPMDGNVRELERRFRSFIEEHFYDTNNPPLFYPGVNNYLIVYSDKNEEEK